MAYFVKAANLLETLPEKCPYCKMMGMANTKTKQTFSKLKLSKIPGNVASESIKVSLPSCDSCSTWLRKVRLGLFVSGFIAILGPVWVIAAALIWGVDKVGEPMFILWMGFIAAWAVLYVLLFWKRGFFKIVYFTDEEVVYGGHEEKYMREVASLNNLTCEKKALYVRVS